MKLHKCDIMIIFYNNSIKYDDIFNVIFIIYLKIHLMQSELLYNYEKHRKYGVAYL